MITIKSPSNIALIKYWGKKNRQEPQNSSISFSLSQSVTTMELAFNSKKNKGDIALHFEFDNQPNEKFEIGRAHV